MILLMSWLIRSPGLSQTERWIVGLKKNTWSSPVHTTHLNIHNKTTSPDGVNGITRSQQNYGNKAVLSGRDRDKHRQTDWQGGRDRGKKPSILTDDFHGNSDWRMFIHKHNSPTSDTVVAVTSLVRFGTCVTVDIFREANTPRSLFIDWTKNIKSMWERERDTVTMATLGQEWRRQGACLSFLPHSPAPPLHHLLPLLWA